LSAANVGLVTSPQNSLLVAFPGVVVKNPVTGQPIGPPVNRLSGSAAATTRNDIWSMDTNARLNLSGNGCYRADMLVGFRYVSVDDDLDVVSRTTAAVPNTVGSFGGQKIAPPFTTTVLDSFHTSNEFYGAQIGAVLEGHRNQLYADFRC